MSTGRGDELSDGHLFVAEAAEDLEPRGFGQHSKPVRDHVERFVVEDKLEFVRVFFHCQKILKDFP